MNERRTIFFILLLSGALISCRRHPGKGWPAYGESKMGFALKAPPGLKPQFTASRTEQSWTLGLSAGKSSQAVIRVVRRGGKPPVESVLSTGAGRFAQPGLRSAIIKIDGRRAAYFEGPVKTADGHMAEFQLNGAQTSYTFQCYVTPAAFWKDYQATCEAAMGSFQLTAEKAPQQIPPWKGEAHIESAEGNLRKGQILAAASEFKVLAEHGDSTAQYFMGEIYSHGAPPLEQDMTLAASWFHKAAEQGHPGAEAMLGTMYVSGTGVPADAAKARTWLTKAANQGVPRAQYTLAMMHLQGTGGSSNPALALDLLHKAAEKRYVPAYGMLGQMYKLGRGTAKDPFLAYFWIDVATRSGYKQAEPLKAQLAKTLTPQQLKNAQVKSQAWVQSHPNHAPQKSTKTR